MVQLLVVIVLTSVSKHAVRAVKMDAKMAAVEAVKKIAVEAVKVVVAEDARINVPIHALILAVETANSNAQMHAIGDAILAVEAAAKVAAPVVV